MGSRRLTLLRHGEAQPIDSTPEDFERVLTRHGIAQANEMADRIVLRSLQPDLILCSPAERAWNTAQIIAAACELDEKQLQVARELYLATPETTWRLITESDPHFEHILICGHNPGLSQVASRLGPAPQTRELPTAGLATALWHADAWHDLQAELAARCDFDDPDSAAELWA